MEHFNTYFKYFDYINNNILSIIYFKFISSKKTNINHLFLLNYLTNYFILTSLFQIRNTSHILDLRIISFIKGVNLLKSIIYPGGDQGDANESSNNFNLIK